MLLDLRRFQAHPVRNDEARATADSVRLDPGKVAMPADLRVLGALPIDRHGAVGHDERDFLVRRGVLEMLSLAVQWDFFFETLDLFSRREVSTEAEFASAKAKLLES